MNQNQSDATRPQASAGTPDMQTLMQEAHVPTPVCDWLTCLRKPAISVQYSMQKRHIPDMQAEVGTQSRIDTDAENSATNAPAEPGQTTDVMSLGGGFTIRYFDLALGALGLMLLGCLCKTCMRLKRRLT